MRMRLYRLTHFVEHGLGGCGPHSEARGEAHELRSSELLVAAFEREQEAHVLGVRTSFATSRMGVELCSAMACARSDMLTAYLSAG